MGEGDKNPVAQPVTDHYDDWVISVFVTTSILRQNGYIIKVSN
jgi:hypothetical protein